MGAIRRKQERRKVPGHEEDKGVKQREDAEARGGLADDVAW